MSRLGPFAVLIVGVLALAGDARAGGVVFINFDGAVLTNGPDDSRINRTTFPELVGQFPAFDGNGAQRDAVLQVIRQHWFAFDVLVTQSRPESGDYTMAMIGPIYPFGLNTLGVATIDCNDATTHNNIVYGFFSSDQETTRIAKTVSQEIAHSYGLEHVDDPLDIMQPGNMGGNPTFQDLCAPLTMAGTCATQHLLHCPAGQQNSFQDLLTLFGAGSPDMNPPLIDITAPMDGDVIAPGTDLDIVISATDRSGIQLVEMYRDEQWAGELFSEPYTFSMPDIAEGVYTFYAVATDLLGNDAQSATITIYVGDGPDETGMTDSVGTDTSVDTDSATTGDDAGASNGDDGCSCRSAPSSTGWIAMLVLWGLRRRHGPATSARR